MTLAALYSVAGVALLCTGLYALFAHAHLIRKILAVNIMSGGITLYLVAMSRRTPGDVPDPVPQALVLTGIVVLVSATALALSIACRLHAVTGQAVLPPANTEARDLPRQD